MNELAPRFAGEATARRHRNLRPRDAATLILVEHRAGIPHILMGRRSARHTFYPGAYVFPGGAVDRADGSVPSSDETPETARQRLMTKMKGRPSARRARGFALAAIRETFEETGILLGVAGRVTSPPGSRDWLDFFGHEVVPALSPLAFIARAITPPRRSRRFDTRFFAAKADAIAKMLPPQERPTDELSELIWLPIEEARNLNIPNITRAVLGDLEERLSSAGELTGDQPVPFYYVVRGSFVREFV